MTARLARLALRLYPLAYRRRYGEEMLALLEDKPPRTRAVLDLLRGALLAHLRPADGPSGVVDPTDRVRAGTSGVLLCWVFFAAAGLGFYKTTEDEPFSLAGHAHPLLRDAHLAVQALAVIASMTVVLAALPLIIAALGHARRDSGMRRKVLTAFLPLIAFGALSAGVLAIVHTQAQSSPTAAGYGMVVLWGIAGLACRHALFATPASAGRLRAALVGATIVTVSMLGIAIATALYAIALNVDSSELAAAPNGPFNVLSTTTSLILQVAVMVGSALLATIATARAWRAEGELAPT